MVISPALCLFGIRKNPLGSFTNRILPLLLPKRQTSPYPCNNANTVAQLSLDVGIVVQNDI
jgi:hypothetical protein